MPPGDYVHLANITGWQITQRLEGAGYLVTRASSGCGTNDREDFTRLRLALRQSVDLAVFIYESATAAKCARQTKVPFLTIRAGGIPGAVAHIPADSSRAMEDLVSDCRSCGVRTIEVVEKDAPCDGEAACAFRSAGFKVKISTVTIDPAAPRPESIMSAGLAAFKNRFHRNTEHLPDMIFFDDNFLLLGAAPLLLQRGVKIPDTVRIATMSTRGLTPALPFPFMCVERDGYADGNQIADGILAYFETGLFPANTAIASKLRT